MDRNSLAALVLLFLITSVVGVVTGSNSLITVPAMFELGIDEKTAVATNMFGLSFMAIGGTIPFLRAGQIEVKRLSPLIVVTLIGSALGALLVGVITDTSLKAIVTAAMIAVVLFSLLQARGSKPEPGTPTPLPVVKFHIRPIGILATFLLAVYGGLYSGGYVTVLTAAFVAFLGMSYAESVGSTKLINVVSSSVATLVFMWQGLVDYSLGAVLAVTMFFGAFIGAHYASRMNEIWLKRIFLGAVAILAAKMLWDLGS